MKKVKALVLLSGGLDSILTVKALQEQGIKVSGLSFKSLFFDTEQAERAADDLCIDFREIDFSKKHLAMVESPKHGYGKRMNPCIDCHALMLKEAKKIMEKEKFDFVATGEVLGERPMSQNKKALELIEKESLLSGYLLRPLSAQLLQETIPEIRGLVDRGKLFAISGRSRKKQMALARGWKIKHYPSPAGGCLLTDIEFSKKFKDLLRIYPRCGARDIRLLKYGRHFWQSKAKIIVGRDHQENLAIKKLAKKGDICVELKDYPGPLTLVRKYEGDVSDKDVAKAKFFTKHYALKARGRKRVKFNVVEVKR